MNQYISCFLFALIVFSRPVFANDGDEAGGIIAGRVVTADGQPAADVTVTIPKLKRTTMTNDEGLFRFSHLAPGSYDLVVTLVGYEPVNQNVLVEGVKPISLAIQL